MFISSISRIPLTVQDCNFSDVNPFKANGINPAEGTILQCLGLGPRVAESKPSSLIGGLLENPAKDFWAFTFRANILIARCLTLLQGNMKTRPRTLSTAIEIDPNNNSIQKEGIFLLKSGKYRLKTDQGYMAKLCSNMEVISTCDSLLCLPVWCRKLSILHPKMCLDSLISRSPYQLGQKHHPL